MYGNGGKCVSKYVMGCKCSFDMGTKLTTASLRRAFSAQALEGQETLRRPVVSLSAAPRMKHKGKTIGKTYPVTPHDSGSGEMELPSYCQNLPDYAADKAMLSTYVDAMLPAILVEAEDLQQMSTLQTLLKKALQKATALSCAGNTTDAIDMVVFNTLTLQDTYPSTLKYKSYEKSFFASCNEVTFGGIPDTRPLQIGDLVTYHVWCHDRGVHANAATTVLVTEPALYHASNDTSYPCLDDEDEVEDHNDEMERANALRSHVQQAMALVAEKCATAAETTVTIPDVKRLISEYANEHGYQWVRHGDEVFPLRQELSTVPSLQDLDDMGCKQLQAGMLVDLGITFVEGHKATAKWSNGWTSSTIDGGLAAQERQTIYISP